MESTVWMKEFGMSVLKKVHSLRFPTKTAFAFRELIEERDLRKVFLES